MFGINSAEILILAFLALIFIGPKELPRVMVSVGRFLGKMRGYARHFTDGIEHAMREAELEEMERSWREQNERILKKHPADGDYPDPPARERPAPGESDDDAVMRPFDLRPGAEEAEPRFDPPAAPEPVEAPSTPLAEWEEEPGLPFDIPAAPDDDPRPPSERELP